MADKKVMVIKDNRDGRIFIDDEISMIRMFETVLEKSIGESRAVEKYPGAINVTNITKEK